MKYEKRRAGFTHGKLSLTNSSSTLTSLRLFFVYFLFPLANDAKNKLVWVQVHSSNVCAHTVLIIKFWLRIQLKHHPQSVYMCIWVCLSLRLLLSTSSASLLESDWHNKTHSRTTLIVLSLSQTCIQDHLVQSARRVVSSSVTVGGFYSH